MHPKRCVFFGDLYPNKECYDAETASGLRMLLKIRKNIASGTVTDYWADANYIGWVRGGQGHKICAVIISNADSYVPFSCHPLEAFEITEAQTNGVLRSLHYLSTSSNKPHTMRMFIGKVSCCGTRGHECMRIIYTCYLSFTVPTYAHTHFYFQGHDQTKFSNVFAPRLPGVMVSKDGWGNFTCARGGIAVWTLASNVAACV